MSLSNLGLDAFEAIAISGTVHEAAKAIGLSQTGVTQRIRSLEKDLETTLFLRSKKGMRLTPDGAILIEYCKTKRNLEAQALSQIQGLGVAQGLTLTISGPTYILQKYCFKNISNLHQKYPELLFNFTVDHSRDLTSKLRSGEADMILMPSRSFGREFKTKSLVPTSYQLVCTPQWQGRSLESLLREEIEVVYSKDDQFIEMFLHQFNFNDIPRRPERISIDSEFLVAELVGKGLGYMMLDTKFSAPLIAAKKLITPLPKTNYTIEWSLVWLDRIVMPKVLANVIKSIG